MSLTASQVDVLDSVPTLLAIPEGDGHSVCVRNRGTGAIYLGPASVTTSNGYQLDAGESAAFDLVGSEALYAIAASGTQRVDTLGVGVG